MPSVIPEVVNSRFVYLPGYARFLLENKIEAFSAEMIRLSQEMKLPLLIHLENIPQQQRKEIAMQNSSEFLSYLADNNTAEFIEFAVDNWIAGKLPLIERQQIVAEDITLICYIRKKCFLKFLADYTFDHLENNRVIAEIDDFTRQFETSCQRVLRDLQQDAIRESLHFIEKINTTTPGLIYIFDLIELKEIYTNVRVKEYLGYTHQELQEMGDAVLANLIHPDDIPGIMTRISAFVSAADGEIRDHEFRAKAKDGSIRWLRSFESVFKRGKDGLPIQVIGNALDITLEKETAAKLKHRGEQLLEAQELTEMGSFEIDLEAHEAKLTPQLIKILNLKEGENLDSFLKMENVHPADRTRLKAAIDEALQGGYYDCEYRYISNGMEKVLWGKGLIRFKHGKPETMKGTIMDVTTKHHMVKRLERSQELFEEAQRLTHIGNWVWLIGDNKVTWSDELFRIYGLEPKSENITFERFLSLVHPEDGEMVQQRVQHSLDTGQPNDFYHRIILKDGTIKTLHAKGEVLTDENNKPYKMVGTGQDVTKQKKIETELTESKNQLAKLYSQLELNYVELENSYTELIRVRKQLADDRTRFLITAMPHIVASATPDGALDYANQHLMEFTGLPFDELKGWGWGKCIYPDDLERLTAAWTNSLQTGKPMQIEFRLLNNAGEPFWHLAKVKPHHDEKGEITMWIATITDVHEQKILEEKKDEFISIASHELKTPLTSAKAYMQLLENQLTGNGDWESSLYVNKANNSINRLTDLISELLDISKIQHGKMAFTFSEFDFDEMLNETIDLIQQTSPKHKIVKNGVINRPIKGDKERLRQVCINLLTNAVKYSPTTERIDVRITNDIDEALIAVTDYGIGIPQGDHEKVFERFYRVKGTSSQYQGLGIGLFISSEIVQRHHGKIWVKSDLSKGSTFYFTLPFNTPK